MSNPNSLYKGYRFSSAVIKHAVWLYYRFNNSLRDTSEALLYRGLNISHETIRQWAYRFGKAYTASLRNNAPRRGDKWHLDEARIMMGLRRKRVQKFHRALSNQVLEPDFSKSFIQVAYV